LLPQIFHNPAVVFKLAAALASVTLLSPVGLPTTLACTLSAVHIVLPNITAAAHASGSKTILS
jgi:hypothetical protein